MTPSLPVVLVCFLLLLPDRLHTSTSWLFRQPRSNHHSSFRSLIYYFHHLRFCFWHSHPSYCCRHHLSWTMSYVFSRSTNPNAILPCISNLSSSVCLNTNIPSVVLLPFLKSCCSSPNSCSTFESSHPWSSLAAWWCHLEVLCLGISLGLAHLPSSSILGLSASPLVLYLASYMYSAASLSIWFHTPPLSLPSPHACYRYQVIRFIPVCTPVSVISVTSTFPSTYDGNSRSLLFPSWFSSSLE